MEIRKILSRSGKILIVDLVMDGVEEGGKCRIFTIRGAEGMLKEVACRLLTTKEREPGVAFFEAENLAEAEVMRT